MKMEINNSKIHKYSRKIFISNVLPKHHKIKFTIIDRLLTKKNVSEIIDTIFRFCGQKETVIFCDILKD